MIMDTPIIILNRTGQDRTGQDKIPDLSFTSYLRKNVKLNYSKVSSKFGGAL